MPDEKTECSFCQKRESIDTHLDGKAELVTMIPLPAINLTTGEKEQNAKPSFFAILVQSYELGEDFVPVEFCPKCGRRLKEEFGNG